MVSQVPEHTHTHTHVGFVESQHNSEVRWPGWAGIGVERARKREGRWTSRFTRHLGVGFSKQRAGGGLPNPHPENTEAARRSKPPATPKIGANYATRRGNTASAARAAAAKAAKARGLGRKNKPQKKSLQRLPKRHIYHQNVRTESTYSSGPKLPARGWREREQSTLS